MAAILKDEEDVHQATRGLICCVRAKDFLI